MIKKTRVDIELQDGTKKWAEIRWTLKQEQEYKITKENAVEMVFERIVSDLHEYNIGIGDLKTFNFKVIVAEN